MMFNSGFETLRPTCVEIKKAGLNVSPNSVVSGAFHEF